MVTLVEGGRQHLVVVAGFSYAALLAMAEHLLLPLTSLILQHWAILGPDVVSHLSLWLLCVSYILDNVATLASRPVSHPFLKRYMLDRLTRSLGCETWLCLNLEVHCSIYI